MTIARSVVLLAIVPMIGLAGCGRSSDESSGPPPEDKIVIATPATPVPAAPFEPGTVTDPESASCGATKAAEFLGQPDSVEVRGNIEAMAQAPGGVRFVLPGEQTTDDLRPDRLNVMIDVTNVVRDLRCG